MYIYIYTHTFLLYTHRQSQQQLDRRIGGEAGGGTEELFWFHFDLPWIHSDALGFT